MPKRWAQLHHATIMRENRKLYPYKITVHQELSEEDQNMARLEMCEKFAAKMDENVEWINDVWFSDEAHFYLNGTISTLNSMCWGSSRPTDVQEQPLHSKRCTAWCALSAHGIIGPFWFEDEEGGTLTVTQVNYRDILDKFCAALGQYRQDAWLQQNGAPPHTA